jgi:hypothetical protein
MTRMRGQSAAAQAHRLRESRCPVHGLSMPQVGPGAGYDRHGQPPPGGAYTIVACPRRDCGVRAATRHIDGPAFRLADAAARRWR